MYKNNHAPFKFDIVGSFLRPDYLKEAREQLKKRRYNGRAAEKGGRSGNSGAD